MARYADSLLANEERIVLRTRQHWLATLIDGRYPWALLIASVGLAIVTSGLGENPFKTGLGYAVLIGVVISLLWLAKIYWNWFAQDYIVTNRRVLKVDGIINKHSADSSLEKINDAVLDQNFIGRLLGYGDLDILTAAEQEVDHYKMLNQAPTFKKEMLNQKHALESDLVRMPSPPLRAAPPAPPPGAPELAAQPAASPASGAASPGMTADQVTATLARLADLRDRGAISPEEYEAKKTELLSRI
jgi:hypothetical protein